MKENDKSKFLCNKDGIHPSLVLKTKTLLPDDFVLQELAIFFKVFGDLTRIKILSALAIQEICVCDIATLFGMTKSAISHQLSMLREVRLVKSRRQGREVFYSLNDNHVVQVLIQGLSHIKEDKIEKEKSFKNYD
jgi:ArsR family transcriptional regulator